MRMPHGMHCGRQSNWLADFLMEESQPQSQPYHMLCSSGSDDTLEIKSVSPAWEPVKAAMSDHCRSLAQIAIPLPDLRFFLRAKDELNFAYVLPS